VGLTKLIKISTTQKKRGLKWVSIAFEILVALLLGCESKRRGGKDRYLIARKKRKKPTPLFITR
jgi:hypothetical protein